MINNAYSQELEIDIIEILSEFEIIATIIAANAVMNEATIPLFLHISHYFKSDNTSIINLFKYEFMFVL